MCTLSGEQDLIFRRRSFVKARHLPKQRLEIRRRMTNWAQPQTRKVLATEPQLFLEPLIVNLLSLLPVKSSSVNSQNKPNEADCCGLLGRAVHPHWGVSRVLGLPIYPREEKWLPMDASGALKPYCPSGRRRVTRLQFALADVSKNAL